MSEKGLTPVGPLLTFQQKVEKSTQVLSVTYDAGKKVLSVIFKRTPAMYEYSGFPPEAWAELQAADSIGSWLYRNVTRGLNGGPPPYAFTKISLPENSMPKPQSSVN